MRVNLKDAVVSIEKPYKIYPYHTGKGWAFDDSRVGLKAEGLVLGTSEMIDRLLTTLRLTRPSLGFTMKFSDEPYNDYHVELNYLRTGENDIVHLDDGTTTKLGGTYYEGIVDGMRMECWLCPALFLYFDTAPEYMYVKAENLPPGFNPIWQDYQPQNVRTYVRADHDRFLL